MPLPNTKQPEAIEISAAVRLHESLGFVRTGENEKEIFYQRILDRGSFPVP